MNDGILTQNETPVVNFNRSVSVCEKEQKRTKETHTEKREKREEKRGEKEKKEEKKKQTAANEIRPNTHSSAVLAIDNRPPRVAFRSERNKQATPEVLQRIERGGIVSVSNGLALEESDPGREESGHGSRADLRRG